MPVKKWEETISKQYHIISGFKVKPTVGLTQNPDESVISIFHRDNDDVVYCTTEGLSKLPEILKNGGYSKETNLNNQHFNQLETSRNNAIIRLVAAFLIYTSAKDTLNLKQGYPVDTTIDMEKGFTKAYWSTYHVNYVPSWKGKKNLEDVTPCHFENITDPDAYKGIDSWIPVGSLWKLVDEH